MAIFFSLCDFSCKSMFEVIEIRSPTSQQRKKREILKKICEAHCLHFPRCRNNSLQTERGASEKLRKFVHD